MHKHSNPKPETFPSNGESNRFTAEIYRDHEALEFAHQTPANQSGHARDEHGDDKGMTHFCINNTGAQSTALGWHNGRDARRHAGDG